MHNPTPEIIITLHKLLQLLLTLRQNTLILLNIKYTQYILQRMVVAILLEHLKTEKTINNILQKILQDKFVMN